MSLESIISRIVNQATKEEERIVADALLGRDRIMDEAAKEAKAIHESRVKKESAACEIRKQREVVKARLDYRKKLLETKQAMIAEVFLDLKKALKDHKVKKEEVYADRTKEVPEDSGFYIAKLMQDYETQIAKILFS